MAKRRKLELPNQDDLSKLEQEFRSETQPQRAPGLTPPIAQVAAQAAAIAPVGDARQRADLARDSADAKTLRDAKAKGLVIQEILLTDIDPDDLARDRAQIDAEEMDELRQSIQTNGQRLPIEIYEKPAGSEGAKYGIISGYRRYLAVSGLFGATQAEQYQTIKCILKSPNSVSDAVVAMVEENEIRSNLSHFERGRVAALSAQNGFYPSLEVAVNTLFAAASKAKRSKIRSFAQVFEELGDLLNEPQLLTERQGLRIAAALRNGAGRQLRETLARNQGTTASDDWAVLDPALTALEQGTPETPSRGGRPKTSPIDTSTHKFLSNGMTLEQFRDDRGFGIRLLGADVDSDLMNRIGEQIEYYLQHQSPKH